MITYAFLAGVALATMVALQNWRFGCVLWLIAAILQDPIRKVTPGTPAYLTLAFSPIYLVCFWGALRQAGCLTSFKQEFPRLATRFQAFAIALACSLGVAIVITGHSPVAAGLGLLSYLGGIPAVLLGYSFLQRSYRDLEPFLLAFLVINCVMLVGVPLEQAGVKFSLPWLGTVASDTVWYRWFNNYDYVAMLSGFHRSPEIMGWHASAVTLVAFYLLLQRPRLALLWGLAASWGVYAAFMSGRRKMLMVMIAFLLAFLWASNERARQKIISYSIVALAIIAPLMLRSVDSLYIKSLDSGLSVATDKLSEKGLEGPIWLLGLVGPFGYGVGSVTQGAQHLGQIEGIPLVEGGVEKVMVELGILGSLLALAFGYELLQTGLTTIRVSAHYAPDELGPPFCFAFVAANLVAFLIAFQFLGDPFIGTFVGFMIGLLLSFERITPVNSDLPVFEDTDAIMHSQVESFQL